MHLLPLARAKIRAWFRRDAVAGEIHDEMQFHLDMREDEYRGQGLAPVEARYAASRRFGSLALMEDRGYDIRGGGFVETVIQDIRYAVRVLLKQRGFSLVAIVTLALGIGLSTALFSVVDATILRPLPYPRPEQLVRVNPEVAQPDGSTSLPTASMDDMRLWQKADDVFSGVAGWDAADGRITDGPDPERIQVLEFTEDYLAVHGVTLVIGRHFTRADTEVGAPPVALLGYGYWQSHYAGRRDIVGTMIRLDDGSATIIGVLPASFNSGVPLSRPLRVPQEQFTRRGTGRVSVIGRLRPDVTIGQARSRLAARMAAEPLRAFEGEGAYRIERTGIARARVTSMLESTVARYQTTVNVMAAAVGLVLLIACVNVAGLLLARGTTRRSELAVRASLGAGRVRLVRQLLTESLVLAVAGAVVGILLARLSLNAIVANIPLSLPPEAPIAINLTVLAATVALLVPTALIFGLVPAIRLSRVQIGSALTAHSRQTGSLSRRGGQTLIAVEVALAVVLVAGAGLMVRSFARISSVDLGFNPDGLVTMQVLPLEKDLNTQKAYYTELLQRIRRVPGIASVGLIDNFALGGSTTSTQVDIEGRRAGSTVFELMPGYLESIEARVRDGRLPTAADYAAGSRGVVINEPAARALFPDRSAIGQFFTRGTPEPWSVVGVIADIRHTGPLNMTRRDVPQIFFPYPSRPRAVSSTDAMVVVMRSSAAPADLAVRLREIAQSIGPRVLVERIRTGDEWFGDRVLTPRRRLVLLSLLGGLGLMLVMVGVFGLTAYTVARRTSEIGVRMAFGARARDVVLMMVRDAALPVLAGLAAGLFGAYYSARVIESFLYETPPHDPATLAVVSALVGFAAILAALVPATRAARVDPVIALRTE